jgi:cytochrome P450
MRLHELVWKETLRLMPVASFLPRRPLRDVKVGGHTLRAGTLALVAAGAMGRHPAWWNEPSKFDPERFTPERAEDKKHPGIYNPFGGGAHVCIGMQLATMEVKAFWHDLLRRCRFRLTKDYDGHHTASPLGTVSGKVELTLDPIGA